jgi:hypothetical protein
MEVLRLIALLMFLTELENLTNLHLHENKNAYYLSLMGTIEITGEDRILENGREVFFSLNGL